MSEKFRAAAQRENRTFTQTAARMSGRIHSSRTFRSFAAVDSGLRIVFLAIVIDRISQSFGVSTRDRGHKKWYRTGPIGALRKLAGKE
jgi:hypothetical protein